MDELRILSGQEIVTKGITKNQSTLPECGIKGVCPNGSWLEQKQIQSAIESRKQLIEVERIEKSAVISHAEWRENIMLAEVTQKVGGYWQFIGHNVGKQLFLNPEETLYLMEINCLLLKHNNMKVSLQQAYSLLLQDRHAVIQYKVYASLSRLGYKVLRHVVKPSSKMDDNNKFASEMQLNQVEKDETENSNVDPNTVTSSPLNSKTLSKDNMTNEFEKNKIEDTCSKADKDMERICVNTEVVPDIDSCNEVSASEKRKSKDLELDNLDLTRCNIHKKCMKNIYHKSIEKLKNRIQNSSKAMTVHKSFKNLSDLLHKQIVMISVPENKYIPENISANKITYTLNLEYIQTKCTRPPSTDSQNYSMTDEVNGEHVRRVRNNSGSRNHNSWTFQSSNHNFQTENMQFRPFNFWRPHANFNCSQFSVLFQRPFLSNMFFAPRFQHFPRFQNVFRQNYFNYGPQYGNNLNNVRKRTRNSAKSYHFDSIQRLVFRLKNLMQSGNVQPQNLHALHRLIQTYNTRYKTALNLNSDYEIVTNESILETIELDDDEESKSKRPRIEESQDTFTENFNKIKQFAIRLKSLVNNEKATTRHKRVFSSLIKTFNKSYNADIYVTSNYEVLDRRYITLDCSSDSDCVVKETVKPTSGKQLRNPFNILKQLSEKCQSVNEPSTSQENYLHTDSNTEKYKEQFKYSETTLKCFGKNWLPNETDFGRAEIVSKNNMDIVTGGCTEFLFQFTKFEPDKYKNWLDLKISFLNTLVETTEVFQNETETEYKSILKPNDCTDLVSILKKLSIIKPYKLTKASTDLNIHYDVYNRDIQNFRKRSPPIPHFRILCLDESSWCPSGKEIAELRSKYGDNVSIVFAVVGSGSICYLQINHTELPMYISSNSVT